MKPLLDITDVSLSYHSLSGETPALSHISFQLMPGEFLAIVGPSGCGKSTLLNLICGLLRPEQGQILLDGTPVTSGDCRIGYMLQKDHLLEWRTIYKNVLLGLEIRRELTAEKLAYVNQLLSDYGLDKFRSAHPSELSGGMRQRAALIRTLALKPELLLLDEPFSALAFKIMTDPFVGKLAFFRVYSGTMNSGSYVLNATKDKKERVGRILQMHANKRMELDKVYSGDIAAAIGFKFTTTGDTICDEQHPVILESMEFPEPVIELAIEPKTKAGQGKLGEALAKLAEEDPTFRAHTDQETGQTIIAGMGELHLDIIVDRLLREFKVEANVGAPQVAYKETITKPVDVDSKYAKQSGGRGQYGHCKVKFQPMDANGEELYKFESTVVGGAIPKEYIPAVGEGIEEAMKAGILGGFPVVGVYANVYDGSYHEVDSSEMAFHIAGSLAFKDAMQKAAPVLLEPIMKVEVTTPEDYMGDVIGDINSRRGRIEGMEDIGGGKMIRGYVPLSEMFGYATDLRSRTQGRGNYSMFFEKYEQVPKSVQEKILSKKD